MAVTLPEPNMEQLDEITVRTSYAKLFESIQEDFVTKYDLDIILASLTPPGVGTYGVGKSLVGVYNALVKVGKAGIKGAVAAGKAAIGL